MAALSRGGTWRGRGAHTASVSRIRGRCREISAILEKTDEPGKYTTRESRSLAELCLATRGNSGAADTSLGGLWPAIFLSSDPVAHLPSPPFHRPVCLKIQIPDPKYCAERGEFILAGTELFGSPWLWPSPGGGQEHSCPWLEGTEVPQLQPLHASPLLTASDVPSLRAGIGGSVAWGKGLMGNLSQGSVDSWAGGRSRGLPSCVPGRLGSL